MGLRRAFSRIVPAITKVVKTAAVVVKKNPALAIAAGGLTLGGFAALPMLGKAMPMVSSIFGGLFGDGAPPEQAAQEVQQDQTAAYYPNAQQAQPRTSFWSWLFG